MHMREMRSGQGPEEGRDQDEAGDEYGDGTCAVPCDMIISAEFGSWGGDIDTAQLPAHFYIDHVRVYKMN